jgi:hypothetical protein
MIRKNLPENPKERKAIVLMEDYEIASEHESAWIHSPNITVLEYPFLDSSILENELCISLENANLIELGAVLSQCPYDLKLYTSAKDTESLILSNALNKSTLVSEFCRKLGATRIYWHNEDEESENRKNEIGGKAGYKIAEAELLINRNLESKVKQELKLEDTYDGNPDPNIEDAQKFLFDNYLSNEKHLTSLLQARTGSGKIKSRKVEYSLTSESMQALKVCGGIKFGLFNANGSYENEIRKLRDIKVALDIEFGKG